MVRKTWSGNPAWSHRPTLRCTHACWKHCGRSRNYFSQVSFNGSDRSQIPESVTPDEIWEQALLIAERSAKSLVDPDAVRQAVCPPNDMHTSTVCDARLNDEYTITPSTTKAKTIPINTGFFIPPPAPRRMHPCRGISGSDPPPDSAGSSHPGSPAPRARWFADFRRLYPDRNARPRPAPG